MRRWLSRMARSDLEPDDLLQEAYAKLVALETVEHIHNPKAYLFQILRCLILEHVRRSQVVAIDAIVELEELQLSEDIASPERVLSGRQELERLLCAIERLPVGCRQVFMLRKLENLTQSEIAGRLKLAVSSVEKHLARALRLLFADFPAEEAAVARSRRRSGPKEEGRGES